VSVAVLALVVAGLRRLLSAAWPAAVGSHITAFDIVIAAVAHQLAWRCVHQVWLFTWCIVL
jgi:hypothetical protein